MSRVSSPAAHLACPLCASELAPEPGRDLGEGETGGRATLREYRCSACGLAVEQLRVDKIGEGRETWRLRGEALPALRARGAGPRPIAARRGRCATCAGTLWAVMPLGHVPAEPSRVGGYPEATRLYVGVELACDGCGAVTQEAWWA